MKKMKRFLVALLSCLTAVACVAGISACKDDKKTASNDSSSSAEKPSYDINVVIPGLEGCAHEYGVVYTIPATCTEEGTNYIACLKCGKNDLMISSEVIPALGHKWVVTEAKAATCTEDGYEAYRTCEVCGVVDGVITPIPAHNAFTGTADSLNAVAATCDKDGKLAQNYCTVCYAKAEIDFADELNVLLAQNKIVASENSYVEKVLELGNVPVTEKVVVPAYHAEVVDYITDSTTTVDGKFNSAIGTQNEKFIVKASATDCTINGVENFKICKTCYDAKIAGITLKADASVLEVIAAYKKAGIYVGEYKEVVSTAHTHVKEDGTSTFVAGKAATCTEAGYEWSYTCTKCGEKVNTVNGVAKVIPALGHTPNGTEVTCAAGIKCTVCDAELQKPAAHKLVSVANKAATCTEAGWTNKKYCENCDYTTETTVPAKQHNWTKKVTASMFTSCKTGTFINSTLLDNGTYYICANADCGMWAQYFAAEGDTPAYYGDAQEASTYIEFNHVPPTEGYVAATCKDDAKNYKCTVCNAILEDRVGSDEYFTAADYKKYVGHKDSGALVAPTCTTAGKCDTCNATLAKLDHKDSDGKSTWVAYDDEHKEEVAATCTVDGHYKAEQCSQCSSYRVWQNGKWVTEYTLANGVKVPVSTDDFVIEAAGDHDYKEVAGKMATCKEDGYTAHKVCTICGEKEGYTVLKAVDVPCKAEHPEASCRVVCNHSYIAKWNDVNKNGICDPEEMDDNVVWAGCGEIIDGTGDCVYGENHVCKVCGEATSAAHTYTDGKCTICGKKKEN